MQLVGAAYARYLTMSARFIIPGQLYRIRTNGREFNVVATDSCSAIVIALEMLA